MEEMLKFLWILLDFFLVFFPVTMVIPEKMKGCQEEDEGRQEEDDRV